MAKIPRIFQKFFGSTGSNGDFGKFGSLAAGSPTFTKDIEEIQSLDAWLKGWGQAVIGDSRPALEDMNSVLHVAFHQLCYLLQQGIPEWDEDTIYFANSFVQVDGQIYSSLTNDNQGNSPASNPSHWSTGIGAQNAPAREVGEIADFGMLTPPSGWLVCDGSAVSRTTYSALFAKIDTTWGVGNGTTTFNLPNLKGRTRVGYDNSQTEFDTIGKLIGAKTHTLTIPEMPSHDHVVYYNNNTPGGLTLAEVRTVAAATNTGSTEDTGGGQPHNNIQPSGVVLTCIKY